MVLFCCHILSWGQLFEDLTIHEIMTWKMTGCGGRMAMQKEVLTRLDDGDQKVQPR